MGGYECGGREDEVVVACAAWDTADTADQSVVRRFCNGEVVLV